MTKGPQLCKEFHLPPLPSVHGSSLDFCLTSFNQVQPYLMRPHPKSECSLFKEQHGKTVQYYAECILPAHTIFYSSMQAISMGRSLMNFNMTFYSHIILSSIAHTQLTCILMNAGRSARLNGGWKCTPCLPAGFHPNQM